MNFALNYEIMYDSKKKKKVRQNFSMRILSYMMQKSTYVWKVVTHLCKL